MLIRFMDILVSQAGGPRKLFSEVIYLTRPMVYSAATELTPLRSTKTAAGVNFDG